MFGYGFQWLRPMDYAFQPPKMASKVDGIGQQLPGLFQGPGGAFVPGGIDTPVRDWRKTNKIEYKPAP